MNLEMINDHAAGLDERAIYCSRTNGWKYVSANKQRIKENLPALLPDTNVATAQLNEKLNH